MGRLILMRHGESEMNKAKCYCGSLNPELTEKGIEQCKNSREMLKAYDYDMIYASDLKRAKKTAEIANYKNLPIVEAQELREKNFGIFEGLTNDEIFEKYPEEAKEWFDNLDDFDFRVGETGHDFHKRLVSFAEENFNLEKNILVVSHWGVVNTLISHYLAGDRSLFWKFSVRNAGFAVFDFQAGCCVLSALN